MRNHSNQGKVPERSISTNKYKPKEEFRLASNNEDVIRKRTPNKIVLPRMKEISNPYIDFFQMKSRISPTYVTTMSLGSNSKNEVKKYYIEY